MFVPFAPYTRKELGFLKASGQWDATWRNAIREQTAGLPAPYLFYPASSANAIHHAYHLCRFEHDSGQPIRSFQTILEFGGGYGSMCRLCHNIGFKGNYIIYDLPAFSALQRFYNSSLPACPRIRTVSDLRTLSADLDQIQGKRRLLIATWSLSESPLDVRQRIVELVSDFDAVLIGYQSEFGEIDNEAYFSELQNLFPRFQWLTSPIPHLPGNGYLFGWQKVSNGNVRASTSPRG